MSLYKEWRHRALNFLQDRGWIRNPKEFVDFKGHSIYASKGAFFRQNEKDDAWLYALAQHNKNILDIGCNIGQSSLLFLLGTDNHLLAVDPNPDALARCAENLIHNDLVQNARFMCAFCGEQDGEIEFFSSLTDAAGSMHKGFAKTSSGIGKSRVVRKTKVDRIVEEFNFKPDLVKMDVEGAEQYVLRGMNTVLENNPMIFVEMHSGPEMTIIENTDAVLAWCEEQRYQAYYLKIHQVITDSEVVKDRGRYHLLLLPQDAPYPEYLKTIKENTLVS